MKDAVIKIITNKEIYLLDRFTFTKNRYTNVPIIQGINAEDTEEIIEIPLSVIVEAIPHSQEFISVISLN